MSYTSRHGFIGFGLNLATQPTGRARIHGGAKTKSLIAPTMIHYMLIPNKRPRLGLPMPMLPSLLVLGLCWGGFVAGVMR